MAEIQITSELIILWKHWKSEMIIVVKIQEWILFYYTDLTNAIRLPFYTFCQ